MVMILVFLARSAIFFFNVYKGRIAGKLSRFRKGKKKKIGKINTSDSNISEMDDDSKEMPLVTSNSDK